MKLTRQFIRSVQGQLSLLAATYAGAILLALGAWIFRSILFEPYIREKFPPLKADLAVALLQVADGQADPGTLAKTIDELAEKETRAGDIDSARDKLWAEIYGEWINRDDLDPANRLAGVFLSEQNCLIFERLRRTLVAGNEQQRGRALYLLGLTATDEDRALARQLCAYARERALRRNEPELVRQAEQVLNALGPAR
jgi:hypothetical protein